jgi:exodeoxyribonuclease VII large subunit
MSEEKKIFTLKQVAFSIQKAIQERYSQTYWVQAEMHKLNYTPKGHCYPELVHKEAGKIVAEIRATIWKTQYDRISENFFKTVKEPIKDGLTLLFLVKISYHPVYGMGLEVLDIDPTFTLGELHKEREETLLKLTKEGVINANQLLPFPLLPKRIAVISVASSKGLSDFYSVIHSNPWNYEFFFHLFSAQLNGDGAISSIQYQLKRIQKFKHLFDCVVIIRGGGGEIGLSCYNNYDLAKAIATFPLPVLTGIGHSTGLIIVGIE